MSEHELWNELGNLYFISGTYSQAVYAYNRSIQLDSGFGRPFCNLALTYVKQGKYNDAVRLYQRSIELLVDDREKAITWYRLGDVYRHLKDYRDAILAYQQADLLDPELSQDRKESGQILYGSSEAVSKQTDLTDPAPALAEVKAVPVTADQEIQTAVASGEEPAEAEGIAALSEEPRVVAAELESPPEEPTGFAQDEPILVEQPVVETAPIAEDTETQVPLLVENLPLDEMDAPDGQVEAVAALQEPLAEEAAPLLIESAPVTVEAGENPLVETHLVTLEEPVHEVVVPPEEEVLPVAATMPETSIEEIPAATDDLEPAGLSELEPALLEEDPAPDFMMLSESPVQEDLTQPVETVSDISSVGWNEDNYPYPDFEHETEVFIPETQEEALDQWLPITEAESFNSEAQSESVYLPDLEQSTPETPNYSEAVRTEYQLAPLPSSQRHAVEASAAASLDVDVIVQDEVAQPLFIIPEGTEQDSPEELDESEQPFPASAVTRQEDEEIKVIEREIERFQQVVQHNPRNASAWDTLGTLYKSAHRYRDAILAYQQAVVVDPLKAPYHHHLGIIYAVEGRDEDAIQAFQEVIEIDPNHSLAHASLGGYYRRIGLEELAQKHIGRAMKNFYSNENEYNRACMEALRGHTEQSIELLRVALKNKQTYVDWVLRDPDLDSIRRDPRFKQLISDYTA